MNKTIYFSIILSILISCKLTNSKNDTTRQSSDNYEAEINSERYNRPFYNDYVKSFLALEDSIVVLQDVKIIDGSGLNKDLTNQSIVIYGDRIIAINHKDSIQHPDKAKILNLNGRTIIPGIIGTHNHLRLPDVYIPYSATRLYLACGVTTIQTCGTADAEDEVKLAKKIKDGISPGPNIINSSPYFTGDEGKAHFIHPKGEKHIQDTMQYWINKGVKWFKVYMNTNPDDLEFMIKYAHEKGVKIAGHLCSITYMEAAEMGIDAIEHGFIYSYDHADGKTYGKCSGSNSFRSLIDINSDEVKKVQQCLIKNNVALSSTPAALECHLLSRVDQSSRVLEVISSNLREKFDSQIRRMQKAGDNWYFKEIWLTKSMKYDLAFYHAGGLLTAGPDPLHLNMPGFGDQRNYELFIEAGFTSAEAINVMTSNGAKLLELEDRGLIAVGKKADLVVINGDLEENPNVIKNVEIIFKDGYGFDPQKLLNDVKGIVGIK